MKPVPKMGGKPMRRRSPGDGASLLTQRAKCPTWPGAKSSLLEGRKAGAAYPGGCSEAGATLVESSASSYGEPGEGRRISQPYLGVS